MKIYKVDKLLKPVGNGSTNPIYGIINNKEYVIKTFNNPEGNKILINELISYLIVKKLDLPMPNAILGIIDNKTFISNEVLETEEFNEECFGIAFCSEVIKPVTTISSEKMMAISSNYESLIPKLMLLDHLIYNKDRNKGNLLISLSKSDSKMYIIDHSHVFNLEALWNSFGLQQRIEDEDYRDLRIMQDNWYHYSKFKTTMDIRKNDMQNAVNYFYERLDTKFFNDIIFSIPEQWEKNTSELKALADYLTYRLEHLNDYANMIVKYDYRRSLDG